MKTLELMSSIGTAQCGNCGSFEPDDDLSFMGSCQKICRCVARRGFCEEWEPDSQKRE